MTQYSTSAPWQKPLLDDLRDLSNQLKTDSEGEPDETGSSTRGLRSLFKDQLSAGGGESFSAEEHRGREVLELFQNASDKCRGPNSSGAVYIGLTENGLLVANTGANFDFSKNDTRDALSIFGYTDKTQDEVGKFGVGLTSIRATGEAYEVWTKKESSEKYPTPEDCWRVRCGPENILAPIAQAFETTANTDPITDLRDDLEAVADYNDYLPDPSETPDFEFNLGAEEFPYFLRPLPLQNWREHVESTTDLSRLEQRGEQLLTGKWDTDTAPEIADAAQSRLEASDIESFTTAVFVEYENDRWRQLFTELSDDSLRKRSDPHELHEQAWYDGRGSSNITPELLLTLGEAETVIVESWLTGAETSEAQVWDVKPPHQVERSSRLAIESTEVLKPSKNGETSTAHDHPQTVNVDVTEVQAELTTASDESHEFWHVTFAEGRTFDAVPWFEDPAPSTDDSDLHGTAINAQLLVPQRGSEHGYRPHLYYPISGLDETFAACLHAEFAVQQDRQSLNGNASMQNACVTAELARLIGCAAEALSRCEEVDDWLAVRMPWRLLPSPPDSEQVPSELATEGTVADSAMLDSLCTAAAGRLRAADVLPTIGDSYARASTEDQIILPEDPDILAGLVALYELDATLERDPHLEDIVSDREHSLLQASAMAALTDWANGPRTEDCVEPSNDFPTPDPTTITDGNDGRLDRLQYFLASTPEQLTATEWNLLLSEWSDRHREHATAAGTAIHTRAPTAVALLEATMSIATPDGESTPDTSTLNDFVPNEAPGPYLLPCKASQSSDSATDQTALVFLEDHTGTNQSRREVLRPNESTEVDLDTAAATFNTYELRQETAESIQAIKDANWGTTELEGPLSLFRSYLKAAANSDGSLSADKLRLLTKQYSGLETPPEATPGAFHSKELVDEIVTADGGNEFDERYKTRLEARRTVLASSIVTGENEARGLDVQFSHGWMRGDQDEPSNHSDITVVEDAPKIADEIESVSDLNPKSVDQTLLMLGVSLLPSVETIARYRDIGLTSDKWNPLSTDSWGNPDPDDDRVDNLESALRNTGMEPRVTTRESVYCDLIVAPGFNPSTSIRHTDKCDVKTYLESPDTSLSKYRVMLATWVWIRPNVLEDIQLGELVSLLQYVGDDFAETVFRTGWSCTYNNGSAKEVIQPVPTLLSWQLRCLPGWDNVDGVDMRPPKEPESSSAPRWDRPARGWSLRYAVQDEHGSESAGLRGIDFLPRVSVAESDDTELSATTLKGLGVKPIEELTAAEAALRLQAVLRNYSQLKKGEATILFEGEIPQGWKTLCEKLLKPICATYQDTSRNLTQLFGYLTHVPVRGRSRSGEAWFALPTKSLAASAVYYEKPPNAWETRIQNLDRAASDADNAGEYLFDGAPTGSVLDGFRDFAEAHELERKERTYPTVSGDLETTIPEEIQSRLLEFDYKKNILAAAPGRQAKQYREQEQRFDKAIRSLRAVDATQDETIGGRNWAYQPVEDGGGIEVADVDADRVRPVIGANIDTDSLPEISGLFEAIFREGRSDSYKLALTGQNVDGVDEARQHLASSRHVSLVEDLRRVASLLGVDGTVDFDEQEREEYPDLRNNCVAEIDPHEIASWDTTAPHELRKTVAGMVEDTNAAQYLRHFAAQWLTTEPTTAETVRKVLSGPPGDPPTGWKSNYLEQIDNWEGLESYLPQERSEVRRLAGVLTAIRDEPTVEEVPEPVPIHWCGSVTIDVEGDTPEPISSLSPLPDTWFELLWVAASEEADLLTTDVLDSPLYTALKTALANQIAGNDDEERDTVRTRLDEIVTGTHQSKEEATTTTDSEIYGRLDGNISSSNLFGGLSALTDSASIRASRRSEKTGTMSESSTNAPRASELFVIKSIVEAVVNSEITPPTVEAGINDLQDDPYQWHYSSTWDTLPTAPSDFSSLDEVDRPDVSYLHVLCDMAEEPIVGFDALDLSGELVPPDASELAVDGAANVQCDVYPEGVNPVPVEVKCVSDVTQPSFRFTTNQVRRALQFVSSKQGTGPQRPFVLQFIELSRNERGYTCENAAAQVLARPADVYDLLGLEIDSEEESVEELLTELVRSGHFQIT